MNLKKRGGNRVAMYSKKRKKRKKRFPFLSEKGVAVNKKILWVAIFSTSVPERELSSKQYATSAAASIAYCSSLNSLSLWHLNAENGNPQNCQN